MYMKYFYRYISKREIEIINGERMVTYPHYLQVIYTDDIEPFNERKRIKFHHMTHLYDDKYTGMEPNKVYEYKSDW